MAEHVVGGPALYVVGISGEAGELQFRVVVHVRTVGCGKMGEDGFYPHLAMALQNVHESRKLILYEPRAVHSSVDLYMHRVSADSILLSLPYHVGKHLHVVDHGLKTRREHRPVVHHLRIHHHDWQMDSLLTELDSLIEHCHSQIGRAAVLKCLRYLVASGSITRCLDHRHDSDGARHIAPEIIEVSHNGVEVDFEHGLMFPRLKHFQDSSELEPGGSLEQNCLFREIRRAHFLHELVG